MTLGKTKDNFNHEKEVVNFSTSTPLWNLWLQTTNSM